MKQTQQIPRPLAAGAAPPAIAPARRLALSDNMILLAVALLALCQGALYLALLPPWQHYDEPTHFEYAWLSANRTLLPRPGDEDAAMRRALAASMIEHQFYWNLPQPSLLADRGSVDVGYSELLHPPAYYLLVSLPLRLVRHLDLASQLYVARAVSLALFVLTIAVAGGLARDLTAPGHVLRWALPLALALLPPFADLMTAVNNDAGAVAVFSLFLWGAVRTIRRGPSWPRAAWLFGAALLAVATKNTAGVALALAPLALLLGFWVRHGWPWRWLALALAGLAAALLVAALGWGDAAGWYRELGRVSQAAGTRVEDARAPLGAHAVLLEVPAGQTRVLLSPLLPDQARQLAGRTVTVGGWVWASRPAHVSAPGVAFQAGDMPRMSQAGRPVAVTTTPTFVAWTFTAPEQTFLVNYTLAASAPKDDPRPLQVYLDGAVIAVGAYPTDRAPEFDDASAQAGTWGGLPFTNLARNPSAEQAWPRVRPWLDQALLHYIHRSPSQLLASLLDIRRIAPSLLPYMVAPATSGMIQSFAWGHVQLASPLWLYLAGCVAALALCGCARWFAERRSAPRGSLVPALALLALIGALVWANTIFRPLPMLGEQYVVPAARYTFPAIIATMLAVVGGWWALWPRRLRLYAALGLVAGLICLNLAAIQTIWSFYVAVAAGR